MKKGRVSKSDAFFTGDFSSVCGVRGKDAPRIEWQRGNWAHACDFHNNDLVRGTKNGQESTIGSNNIQ